MAGGTLQTICNILSDKVSLPHSYHKFDPLQVQSMIIKSFNTLTLLNEGTIHLNMQNAPHYPNINTMAPNKTIPYHLHLLTTTLPSQNDSLDDVPGTETYLSLKKKYKPVALKVKPVIGSLPERFRIIRDIKGDPLVDLPVLPTNPPKFKPTRRYTQEHKDLFNKAHPHFLLPAEHDLLHYFMMAHQDGFAWETSE